MTDQLTTTQERCPDCLSPFPAVRGLTLLIGTDCGNPWHDQQDVEGVPEEGAKGSTGEPQVPAPSTSTQGDLQTLRDAVNDAYSLDAFNTLHSDASGALDRIEALHRPATEPAIIHRDPRGLLSMIWPEGLRSTPVAREVLEQFITDANRQTFRITELERALVKHHDVGTYAIEDWGKQCPICVGLFPESHIPEEGEA